MTATIKSQTNPPAVLLDESGNPVEGVTASTSIGKAIQKVCALDIPVGEVRKYSIEWKIEIEALGVAIDCTLPDPDPTPDPTPDPDPDPDPDPGNGNGGSNTRLITETSKTVLSKGHTFVQANIHSSDKPYYTPWGIDYPMSYMLGPDPIDRVMVFLHPDSGDAAPFVTDASSYEFGRNMLEVHVAEEKYGAGIGGWWLYSGPAGERKNYNGRKIAAALDYALDENPAAVAALKKGIRLKGKSLGGTGVMHQPMILPEYSQNIAIVEAYIANMMMSLTRADLTTSWTQEQRDSVDQRLHVDKLTNIHWFWQGGTNDALGRYSPEFWQLCEQHKISASGAWHLGGHAVNENGYTFPPMFASYQDVTLDKPLPVITNNTANNMQPDRGWYNLSVRWNHEGITDAADEVVVPLKYERATGIGGSLIDMPQEVSFSLTLRRLVNFKHTKAEWEFGTQSGTVELGDDGLFTVDGLKLTPQNGFTNFVLAKVGDVVVDPDPIPDPDPLPDPLPDPDPDGKPADITMNLDQTSFLSPTAHYGGGSGYVRRQYLVVLTPDSPNINYRHLTNWATRNFIPAGTRFVLFANGRQVLDFTTTEDSKYDIKVIAPVMDMDEGWNVLRLWSPGIESYVPFPVFVQKGAEPVKPDWMPAYTASHEFKFKHKKQYLKWVPTRFKPTEQPLPLREYTPFSEAVHHSQIFRRDLVPYRGMDIHRPLVADGGIWNTSDDQRYTYDDAVAASPVFPLLDGPRGVGCASGILFLQVADGQQEDKPDSPRTGNVYYLENGRLARVAKDGRITTLVGHRTKPGLPGHYRKVKNRYDYMELVGDWDAIAPERRKLVRPWGMCWYKKTTEVDPDAAPIPSEDNRIPHRGTVHAFIANTGMDCVNRVEFDGQSHDKVPPVVTEFATGLGHPFVCREWRDKLILTEQSGHRITQWDMKTGAFERVILEGAPLSRVAHNQWVHRLASLEEIRNEPVVGPEGLFIVGDWAYFTGMAFAQIRRVHLVTGELEIVVPSLKSTSPTGLKFITLAISDGTFGPAGTMFVAQHENRVPQAYLPDGTRWKYHLGATTAYDFCADVRGGRMVFGGTREGIIDLSLRLPTDPVRDNTLYERGKEQWQEEGWNLKYGDYGLGFYGLELPWGVSTAMDYFLTENGLVKG